MYVWLLLLLFLLHHHHHLLHPPSPSTPNRIILSPLLLTTSLSMFPHRGLLHLVSTFTCLVVLSCAFFCLDAYGLCSINGIQNPPDYDAYVSSMNSYNDGSSDTIDSGSSLGYGFPANDNSFENVCPNSNSFCFPSTLLGSSHKEKSIKEVSVGDSGSLYNSPFRVELAQDIRQESNKSWSSDFGVFRLLNGKFVYCSMSSREGVSDVPSLQTEDGHGRSDISSCGGSLFRDKTAHSLSKNSETSKSSSFEGSISPNVSIGPTVLDWGEKYLYSSSEAFLTVANTCNDSILHLYEPFSTDTQFYPCNFSGVSLRPGESALICFVFFPRCLGLSQANLILQTSSGGFIVEAKGYATESPFGIQPLSGLKISPGGGFSKNLSLFNPFDETLYVEEITAWISVSLRHSTVETESICSINDFQVFDTPLFPTIKDRLGVKSSQIDSPIVAFRPSRNWEIGPHSSETLMEMDIKVGFEGKVFGAFCLHLLRSSKDMSDTIMVPIEAEVESHSAHDSVGVFVSASLEVLVACDGEIAITISLKNYASYVLSFVKVVEVADMKLFHIKSMEGLLLFPGTVTQVGIIYCSQLNLDLNDLPSQFSNLPKNCKLLILTNDSTSPLIEIPCEDILYVCSKHQRLSYVGVEDKSKHIKSGNMVASYVGRSMQLPQNGVVETSDVEELVLGNWKSQGTTDGMSVLEDHKLLFPMIQVGSYVSRWITVKNPSQHPVIMQLILNSGELIDECRGIDDLLHPFASDNLVLDEGAANPTKHGFSLPETALTEVSVHPYDHATLGPIIFYPSNRCRWSGSALIRNNLSGVEWIPLQGFGGLLSLVLLERSHHHVHSVDFKLKMPKPLNFSLPYNLFHMKEMVSTCSKPLVKELYAKNTGDLLLEVIRIRVSGRECGLDGFNILPCKGFTLEPGESTKLLISYQTDFSAAMVHRDLELALSTGIFLIPIKTTIPHDMLSNCKKAMFWMRVRKSLLVILLVASLLLLISCFIFPQTSALGSLGDTCEGDDNLDHTTIKSAVETTLLHHNQRKSKLSMSGKMNHLMEASCGRYSYGQGNPSELGSYQNLLQTSENNEKTSHLLDTHIERELPSTTVQGSDPAEASQSSHLMVNTGKGKSRRRKRKSLGAKLQALSEVSSSQSGNSTPSSPLSPAASATPKCNWLLSHNIVQPLEALSPMTRLAAQHYENDQPSSPLSKATILEPEVPRESCTSNRSSPQVPHSASSIGASTPVQIPLSRSSSISGGLPPSSMVSNSATSLQSRAPGSKLHIQKGAQAQEEGLADEHIYDIWGDHFSGFHLLGPKNVTSMKSSPAENNFDSFFVRGPQTLVAKSQEG